MQIVKGSEVVTPQGQGQASVSLAKAVGVEHAPQPRRLPPVGAPLHSHRYGLRMNDPVTLHSALFILALRGGTQHLCWSWTSR